MPLLTRPCGDISYHDQGAGQPVLLSHGFGATSAMFSGNAAAIAARHRLLTWDLRGHGASQSPADPACYPHQNAIADMVALLDELGVERAVLGGHSLGGYLSLDFTLSYPDRVAGLILIDTGPGFRNDEARTAWNQRADRTAARLAEQGVAALGDSSELHAGGHADVTGLVLAARETLPQQDGHVIDGLTAITAPALVVVGAGDKHFLAAADYMAGKMQAARKVVIPDAGHAPNVDQPALFNTEVVAFLDEISAPAGTAS